MAALRPTPPVVHEYGTPNRHSAAAAHAAGLASAQRACAEARRAVEVASSLARQLVHTQVAGLAMADLRADAAAHACGMLVKSESDLQPCGALAAPVDIEPPRYLRWKRELEAGVRAARHLSQSDKLQVAAQLEVAAAPWHAQRMHPKAWPEAATLTEVDPSALPRHSGPVQSAADLAACRRVSRDAPPASAPRAALRTPTRKLAGHRACASASPRRCVSPDAQLWRAARRARARAGVYQLMQPQAQSWDASTALPSLARRSQTSRSAEIPLPRREATVRGPHAQWTHQHLDSRRRAPLRL